MIFSCSGAADVGAVADRAARKLHKEGAGQMFCLAGIGGKVEPILQKTRAATTILAIDGCPLNCVSECLKKNGFMTFKHYLVTELGFEKGKTEVSDAAIEKVAAKGRELLA